MRVSQSENGRQRIVFSDQSATACLCIGRNSPKVLTEFRRSRYRLITHVSFGLLQLSQLLGGARHPFYAHVVGLSTKTIPDLQILLSSMDNPLRRLSLAADNRRKYGPQPPKHGSQWTLWIQCWIVRVGSCRSIPSQVNCCRNSVYCYGANGSLCRTFRACGHGNTQLCPDRLASAPGEQFRHRQSQEDRWSQAPMVNGTSVDGRCQRNRRS